MSMPKPQTNSAASPAAAPAKKKTKGPLLDLKARIERLEKLPPMPEMAVKILRLSADPNAHVKELVEVIELDPSLASQIMRYASSPFFAYQGKIDSVHTAITRVLGYNTVMNLALGATAARPFKIPRNVPLGLDAHWRHAVYSAALVQALSSAVSDELRPPAGLAYLAGLLHNIGHLLLGHLFKQEFLILNKFITHNPDKSIIFVERQVIGTDHNSIGAWLMDSWRLPEEITVAVKEHHNEQYQGAHSVYSQLVMLADRLLRAHGIGDTPNTDLPPTLLESLGIGEYQAVTITNKVLEGCESLEAIANRFTV